jgi:hypothetical protein
MEWLVVLRRLYPPGRTVEFVAAPQRDSRHTVDFLLVDGKDPAPIRDAQRMCAIHVKLNVHQVTRVATPVIARSRHTKLSSPRIG